MLRKPFDRVLAAFIGIGFILMGVAELIFRLDEPLPLFFWLPTLWGGAALVLMGAFRVGQSERLGRSAIILGALLGFLPSAWTVLMPVLIIALVVRTAIAWGVQE